MKQEAWYQRFWSDYNLSIVLALLWIASWILQTLSGWSVYQSDQEAHQQVATILGSGGYLAVWAEATFENWQSEFLQLLTFVVLTAKLVHRGSHESRDSSDHMQASLDRIEARLYR